MVFFYSTVFTIKQIRASEPMLGKWQNCHRTCHLKVIFPVYIEDKESNGRSFYGKGETAVKALDNVSFTVNKGEFIAIVGPSGSGKSTLLHLLGGVDRPTSGKVFVDNTDIYSLNETNLAIFRRRQIGLIYQFYNLIPVLTVEENLTLPLLLDGHKVDKEHFEKIVSVLGLSERLNHLPNQLSGGEQQRRALHRSLRRRQQR